MRGGVMVGLGYGNPDHHRCAIAGWRRVIGVARHHQADGGLGVTAGKHRTSRMGTVGGGRGAHRARNSRHAAQAYQSAHHAIIPGRCPRGYATAGRTSQNNAAQQLSFSHGAAVVRHG